MMMLRAAIRSRKKADTEVPMTLVVCCSEELPFLTWSSRLRIAEVQQHGQGEHDAGVPQGEEKPHAQRALSVAQKLAGGVVNRRDVVGVERVSHPEGVGQRPRPEAEDPVRLM